MTLARRLFGRLSRTSQESQRDELSAPPVPSGAAVATIDLDGVRKLLNTRQWDALAAVGRSLDVDAHDPATASVRALVLTGFRHYREAHALYARLALDSPTSVPWLDAAWCAHLYNRAEEALRFAERAASLASGAADVDFALAVMRMGANDLPAAKAGFLGLLERDPAYPDGWLNLGYCERALGQHDAAAAAARRALEAVPDSAAAWVLLASTLRSLDRDDDALAAFARARASEHATGEDVRATALHAVTLTDTGRHAEAIALCEGALASTPDSTINTAYAFALLSTGRTAEGWQQYEFRWCEEPMRSVRVRYDRKPWQGQPLAGKTILLRSEQGLGDVIQFARYAIPLKAMGATVHLHAHAGLGTLATQFEGVDKAMEVLPIPPEFDYFISMMSLPRVFATGVGDIPAKIPYLAVADEWRARWSGRLHEGRLRIGLAWSGSQKHLRDRFRSLPLALLEPLWSIPGVVFVSLQKDVRDADRAHLPKASNVLDIAPELHDLSDAAAVIEQLDVLICVDTALAHLAGALGKPVWMLVPAIADFRWLEGREDTPWYPTMRLFRQERQGDWDPVVRRVVDRVRTLAAGDRGMLDAPAPSSPPPVPRVRPWVTMVTEARDGIFQYLPGLDEESDAIGRYGEYLPRQLDLVAALVPMDAWVVEDASGIGSHAVWLAKVLGPDAHLLLYESRPNAARMLRQNLESNGVTDRVTLPRGHLAAAGSARPDDARALEPPGCTIDDLQLTRLDLLKLRDPERADAILDGAQQTLWRLRPCVLVAARDREHESGLAERLRDCGYRSWSLQTNCFQPDNYNEVPDDMFGRRTAHAVVAIPEEAAIPAALDELESL